MKATTNVQKNTKGFSAIELLITLFVAAVFLITGYQLFTSTLKENGKIQSETNARNTASDYLKKIQIICNQSMHRTDPTERLAYQCQGTDGCYGQRINRMPEPAKQ